jgi:hypothetical protein
MGELWVVCSLSRQGEIDQFLPLLTGSNGSKLVSGLGVDHTDWLKHYRSIDQLNAQRIPKIDVHCLKDISRQINDNVPAALIDSVIGRQLHTLFKCSDHIDEGHFSNQDALLSKVSMQTREGLDSSEV